MKKPKNGFFFEREVDGCDGKIFFSGMRIKNNKKRYVYIK